MWTYSVQCAKLIFFLKYNFFSLFSILWIPLIVHFILLRVLKSSYTLLFTIGLSKRGNLILHWDNLIFQFTSKFLMGNLIFLWAVKACMFHDVVVKWKHFPRYWPFVRGIHQSLVNSPHKVLWLGTLMFSLICAWTNSWVNNQYAGDLRHHHAHYDFTVMPCPHVRMRLDLEMQFITIWMYSLYFMSRVS